MASEIIGWEQHWKSDRFKKELSRVSPDSVIFDDEDPRIVLTKDQRGEPCWVIGYTPRINLPGKFGPDYYVGGYVIVISVHDYSVNYIPERAFKGPDGK